MIAGISVLLLLALFKDASIFSDWKVTGKVFSARQQDALCSSCRGQELSLTIVGLHSPQSFDFRA